MDTLTTPSAGWNRPFGYPAAEPRGILDISGPAFPPRPLGATASTVSSDILRHPLSDRARRLLERAIHIAELGDHTAAIEALRDALAKQPAAAPYIQSALGMEYIETRQFAAALTSFAESLESLPHVSAAHSNFGLSLAVTGQLDQAERELRKALDLDRGNTKAQAMLEIVRAMKPAPSEAVLPAASSAPW